MRRRERVVVERAFDEAKLFDELQRAEDAVAWCLEQHEVKFTRSYLSLDGRSMVCLYDAPDAEAVRETQRRGGLPFTRAWTATELTGTGHAYAAPPGFSTVVVERELPAGVTLEQIRALVASPDACFHLHRATLLASHVARDARRMVCVYSAPDAESVRRANVQARQPVSRAWAATAHFA